MYSNERLNLYFTKYARLCYCNKRWIYFKGFHTFLSGEQINVSCTVSNYSLNTVEPM